MNFEPVIGLEIHIQLKTKTKMFCACLADFWQSEPNTRTCPVCLGLPGALPVVNQTAFEQGLKAALALGCQINYHTHFERKNYFYPDLPKGYQISQFRAPLGVKGFLNLPLGGRKIGISRVHLEEDTAKSFHTARETLIDFNKSGVPLLEIVSDPDISSADEAVEYGREIRALVRSLPISDADMEKGQMRLEANISLRKQGEKYLPPYRVEVKNINSFKFLKDSINYEITRQEKALLAGERLIQETRGFDEKKGVTLPQRTKEEARDYRYFTEPDIPPFYGDDVLISNLKSELTETGYRPLNKLIEDMGIAENAAKVIAGDDKRRGYFESLITLGANPVEAAKLVVNRPKLMEKDPASIVKMLSESGKDRVEDQARLRSVVNRVMRKNDRAVADFRKGKETALKFLVGQVMRETEGKADAKAVERLLEDLLS